MRMNGLFLAFLCLSALVSLVSAHGRLTVPETRDVQNGRRRDQQHAPVFLQNGDWVSGHVCRDLPFVGSTATYQAGGTYSTEWFFEANHPGDCFFYLSFDNEQTWAKIAEIRDCHLLSGWDMTIPSWVPSGPAVLRWEWYALQQVINVEHYLQCADVTITGGNTGAIAWTPVVTIPGHLPLDASGYRLVYDENAPFFFTGPAVAQYISGGTTPPPPPPTMGTPPTMGSTPPPPPTMGSTPPPPPTMGSTPPPPPTMGSTPPPPTMGSTPTPSGNAFCPTISNVEINNWGSGMNVVVYLTAPTSGAPITSVRVRQVSPAGATTDNCWSSTGAVASASATETGTKFISLYNPWVAGSAIPVLGCAWSVGDNDIAVSVIEVNGNAC